MSETVKSIAVAVLQGTALGFAIGTALAYVWLCRQDGKPFSPYLPPIIRRHNEFQAWPT